MQRNDINIQENKLKSLQKLVKKGYAVNEKNLKEILKLKREI